MAPRRRRREVSLGDHRSARRPRRRDRRRDPHPPSGEGERRASGADRARSVDLPRSARAARRLPRPPAALDRRLANGRLRLLGSGAAPGVLLAHASEGAPREQRGRLVDDRRRRDAGLHRAASDEELGLGRSIFEVVPLLGHHLFAIRTAFRRRPSLGRRWRRLLTDAHLGNDGHPLSGLEYQEHRPELEERAQQVRLDHRRV